MHAPPTILALLQWSVASLVLLGAALVLSRPLRVGLARLDILVVGCLWIFLATLTTLAAGLLGVLQPTAVFTASLVGGAVLTWGWLRRGWGDALHFTGREPRPARAPGSRIFAGLCIGLLALQALRMGVHVWLLPPHIVDTLVYHLPNVAEWIQAERIFTFETPIKRTYWPANFALLQTWFVLFWQHDFLLDAAGIPYYALAVGSVYSTARSLRATPTLALFVAVLFAYTPALVLHATSGNNDIAPAALFLLLLALIADGHRRGGALAPRLVVAWLVLCLGMGTKPYIAFLMPGLALACVWWVRARHRRPAAATGSSVGATGLVLAATSGALVGSFWYARNWVEFGNPFHPTDFRLFGELVFGTGTNRSQQGSFSLAGLADNWRMLVDSGVRPKSQAKLFDDWWPFHADLANMTGWGWFAFACGIPALLWGAIARPPLRWLAPSFVLALSGVLAFVTPDIWNMRFGLWFPALFALCFGCIVARIQVRSVRGALCALALFCTFLNFVGTLSVGKLSADGWRFLANLPVAERRSAALGMFIGTRYDAALQIVPREEVLGYYLAGDAAVYPLYDADYSQRIRYVPLGPEADVAEAMREAGVRFLFVAKPWAATNALRAAEEAGTIRQVAEGVYVAQT